MGAGPRERREYHRVRNPAETAPARSHVAPRRWDWVIRPDGRGVGQVGLDHFSVVIAAGGMVSRGAATPAWVQSVHARFFPGCAGVTAGKRVPYLWFMTQAIHSSSPCAHQPSLGSRRFRLY